MIPAEKEDIRELQDIHNRAFAAYSADGIPQESIPMPDGNDIEMSMNNPSARVYKFMLDGKCAGCASVIIDAERQKNELELFFIAPEYHGKGLGTQAWQLLENGFPAAKVWELVTPYYEKRNIHFYVNKCGFHIVEYFCEHHKSDFICEESNDDDKLFYKLGGMFRFEKHRKSGIRI